MEPFDDEGSNGAKPDGLGLTSKPEAEQHPLDVISSSRDTRALALLKELGGNVTEQTLVLMPNLLSFLKHDDPVIVRHSIASGTSLFSAVLREMALQFRESGEVEGWLEQMWEWMVKFKDAVVGITIEAGSAAAKVLAVKFLENCVLLFTSDVNDSDIAFWEGKREGFNVSLVAEGHPILNPVLLRHEVNKLLGILLDILQSTGIHYGSFKIAVINCLAAIGKKRPVHYSSILSALLSVDPNMETLKGGHLASIRYSLRTALVGFLRSSHPLITESREKLLKALRALCPGEATDQIIRQAEKMSRSLERMSRDVRLSKEDPTSVHVSTGIDIAKKRPTFQANDGATNRDDTPVRRTWPISAEHAPNASSSVQDNDDPISDFSAKASVMDSDMSPVEKMIAMIGALLAEGERGVGSLEILISNIHPDLLADIVIENMKHLQNDLTPLFSKQGYSQIDGQTSTVNVSLPIGSAASATVLIPSSALSTQFPSSTSSVAGLSVSSSDIQLPNLSESRRDPRRDPRRLDPRRPTVPVAVNSAPFNSGNNIEMQSSLYGSTTISIPASEVVRVENALESFTSKNDVLQAVSLVETTIDATCQECEAIDDDKTEPKPSSEVQEHSMLEQSPVDFIDEDLAASTSSDATANDDSDGSMMDTDQTLSAPSTSIAEDRPSELPLLPQYTELTDDQRKSMQKLIVTRIIEDYKQIRTIGGVEALLPLLARLVAQIDADDDIVMTLQKQIMLDYNHLKGHELAMHLLYQLHGVMSCESDEHYSLATNIYEKFLLGIAKSLLDSLPASDKSFTKLLGDAPFLPESVMRLLEDLCRSTCNDQDGKNMTEGDRVTQGLGTVWSLILGRPNYRQTCLDIALKCAVDSQEEVRGKAIRLVTNKLYPLSYASDNVEQFAVSMLLSVVNLGVSASEFKAAGSSERRIEISSEEPSISGSQGFGAEASEIECIQSGQPSSQTAVSLPQAQQQTSLFFALCTKKTGLLRLVFDIYGRAPKAVKQSIHRHVPTLLRSLGSSCSEILSMISDSPEGSENLVMLVLQIMTEEMTPSPELIIAVKKLYETKLKDAAILIPLLSSLSKDEVLPIFPRLVDLPLEKFQLALARILQGSAHTGPALTPVEVLVAIHGIAPEKDGIVLKKIMDACTACFEQRTVFTQHVLAKSLNHLVEQVPLPLLLMRTIIQAIDAFPTLVEFVMGILSKLVNKQIWKMPKLWVGFLKCVSQTQPHSFHVLLQLPPPQLESALNKYPSMRGSLSAYANQPNIRASLQRPILKALGLVNETQQGPRPMIPGSFHPSDTSSSVHSTTLS